MEHKKNASLGHAFENEKGNISIKITPEGLASFVQNASVGGFVVLKFNKLTVKGNKHYFADILPPMEDGASKYPTKKPATKGSLD